MPTKKKKIAKKKPAKQTTSIRQKKIPDRKAIKKALSKKVAKKISAKPQQSKTKQANLQSQPQQAKATVIGKITHYFPHVNAAVVKLKAGLKIGDNIQIKGHTTDLKETVTSMQINRVPITEAKKGNEIGLSVASRVRAEDIIYRIS